MENRTASFAWVASMSAVALAGCSGSPTDELGVPARPLADGVSEARDELTLPDFCAEFSADTSTATSPNTATATAFCLNHHLKHPYGVPYSFVYVSFPNLATDSAGCSAASVRLRVHHKTATGWPILLDTTFHAQIAGGICLASGDRILSNPGGELWANIVTDPLTLNDIESQWFWGP